MIAEPPSLAPTTDNLFVDVDLIFEFPDNYLGPNKVGELLKVIGFCNFIAEASSTVQDHDDKDPIYSLESTIEHDVRVAFPYMRGFSVIQDYESDADEKRRNMNDLLTIYRPRSRRPVRLKSVAFGSIHVEFTMPVGYLVSFLAVVICIGAKAITWTLTTTKIFFEAAKAREEFRKERLEIEILQENRLQKDLDRQQEKIDRAFEKWTQNSLASGILLNIRQDSASLDDIRIRRDR